MFRFTMLYTELPNISVKMTDSNMPPNMGPDMRPIRPSTPNMRFLITIVITIVVTIAQTQTI